MQLQGNLYLQQISDGYNKPTPIPHIKKKPKKDGRRLPETAFDHFKNKKD